MFGIGSTELLIILLVALIVLGPKSLAGAARSLGKAMGEFRRVSTDFQRTLNMEAAQAEAREAEEKKRKQAAHAKADTAETASGAQKQNPTDYSNNASATDELLANLPPDSPVVKAVAKAEENAGKNSND